MSRNCRYDEAGPWLGGRNCADGMKRGTAALGRAIVNFWGGLFQGFSCRPNTADATQMSVHGTGRALDIFPQSRAEGDQIAAYLVAHHKELGIQLVIWWRRDWQCGPGWSVYGGPNPHTDHIHAEQDAEAAETVFPNYFLSGGFSIMDRATKTYMDVHFQAIRTAQARAARRQIDQAAKGTARHRQVLQILGGSKEDLAELDRELTLLRGRVANLDQFIRDQGADPEAEDDEFAGITPPESENPDAPFEGPDEP